jgi:8-oxo-dGTP pyrophosphatase MutT (NUDIX family)
VEKVQILSFNEYNYTPILEKKKDKLSGIVLIVGNDILLVKPKKFKGKQNKWSIPKGKIEKKYNSIQTAFLELQEETGIKFKSKVKPRISEKGILKYKKGRILKVLDYYVLKLRKSDLNVKVLKNGEVPKKFFKGSEIFKVKFMNKDEARSKIEWDQIEVLNHLR